MPSGFWLGWDTGAPPAHRPAPFSPTWLSGCPADPLASGPLTLLPSAATAGGEERGRSHRARSWWGLRPGGWGALGLLGGL